MKDSVIAALESMLALQRWNCLPRLETWVEAENAAYVTHLAYAIGRASGLTQEQLTCLLQRALLKSLNKHFMTDINVVVREKMKIMNPGAWTALVDGMATKTSGLFPRRIAGDLNPYLTDEATYTIPGSKKKNKNISVVEDIVKYAQLKAAIDECATNAQVYKDHYDKTQKELTERLAGITRARAYEKILSDHGEYFTTIRRLKYLRRWNRINRLVPSTVLGHTYLVAVLSVMFGLMPESEHKENGQFLYLSILRGLFHDVPESLTGDIITPVKDVIAKADDKLLGQVESDLMTEFINAAPSGVKEDITEYGLIAELSSGEVFSSDSLVKDCDRMALVLECVFERASGVKTPEIESAYVRYCQELGNSEWTAVRDFMGIVMDLWLKTP